MSIQALEDKYEYISLYSSQSYRNPSFIIVSNKTIKENKRYNVEISETNKSKILRLKENPEGRWYFFSHRPNGGGCKILSNKEKVKEFYCIPWGGHVHSFVLYPPEIEIEVEFYPYRGKGNTYIFKNGEKRRKEEFKPLT